MSTSETKRTLVDLESVVAVVSKDYVTFHPSVGNAIHITGKDNLFRLKDALGPAEPTHLSYNFLKFLCEFSKAQVNVTPTDYGVAVSIQAQVPLGPDDQVSNGINSILDLLYRRFLNSLNNES